MQLLLDGYSSRPTNSILSAKASYLPSPCVVAALFPLEQQLVLDVRRFRSSFPLEAHHNNTIQQQKLQSNMLRS
jgi:hypothetical protein